MRAEGFRSTNQNGELGRRLTKNQAAGRSRDRDARRRTRSRFSYTFRGLERLVRRSTNRARPSGPGSNDRTSSSASFHVGSSDCFALLRVVASVIVRRPEPRNTTRWVGRAAWASEARIDPKFDRRQLTARHQNTFAVRRFLGANRVRPRQGEESNRRYSAHFRRVTR